MADAALSQRMLEYLQQKRKKRAPLKTAQDIRKYGDSYDPSTALEARSPSTPGYLSSPYDTSPAQRGSGASEMTEQMRSIGELGGAANTATAEAVSYRRELTRLRNAAQSQAMGERDSDIQKKIDELQAANPNIDLRGTVDPGKFTGSTTPVFIGGSPYFVSQDGTLVPAKKGMGGDSGFGSSVSSKRQKVLAAAKRQLGKPYQWGGGGGKSRGRSGATYGFIGAAGGSNLRGFDCSGLTDYAFSQIGYSIGYTTREQAPWAGRHGKVVPKSKLVPGDIVFGGGSMGNTGGVHHVGIYWGNGKIIEAPQTWVNGKRGKVRIAPMRAGQWGVHLNY